MLNQVVIFLLLCVNLALVVGTLAGKSKLSDIDEQKIEQRLKQLNKPAVKSVHSPDGDIIDCVWIYHQPAFDHPLLKNHIIQMRPKSDLSRDKTGGNKTNVIHQLWRTKGECPENTIPIRRITRDDFKFTLGYTVTDIHDFSSIGPMIHTYGENGCYNLKCGGFVQVNKDFVLGRALIPISTYNGDQYDFHLTIEKEQYTGRWWLIIETYLVGYWPSSIVPKLANSAQKIAWGGEIVDHDRGSREAHTLTQMGSGHFAEEGFMKAAYFNSIEYIDRFNQPITPSPLFLSAIVTRPECYNLQVGFSQWWGTYFFYGGPGRNPHCL